MTMALTDCDQEIDVVRDVIRLTMDLRNNPSGWRSAEEGSPPKATAQRTRFPKKRYLVIATDNEKGPYTMEELRAAMKDKTLSRMTLVRAENDDNPQRLGELL
jgi:hypothetical protein